MSKDTTGNLGNDGSENKDKAMICKKPHRLKDLNPHLVCTLCGGYLIDATTVTECLHTFCRSCIVRYLEESKFCPVCDVQVHKIDPFLGIKQDKLLQNLLYMVVPNLHNNEMTRRKKFYSKKQCTPVSPEDGGCDIGRKYILAEDDVSIALKPCKSIAKSEKGSHISVPPRYLRCRAGLTIGQLQKLLRAKFDLPQEHPICIYTADDNILPSFLTIVDVSYCNKWHRNELHTFYYKIFFNKKIKFDPCIDAQTYKPKITVKPLKISSKRDQKPSVIFREENSFRRAPLARIAPAPPKVPPRDVTSTVPVTYDKLTLPVDNNNILPNNDALAAFKTILPYPQKQPDILNFNSIQIPQQEFIPNYGLSVVPMNTSLPTLIPSYIDSSGIPGTVLPLGITLGAPSVLCAQNPIPDTIPGIQFQSLPLVNPCTKNVVVPSASIQTSVVNSMDMQPITSILDNTSVKEEPEVTADKEVQLTISESGVVRINGGETSDDMEAVLNTESTEVCDLLSRIERGSIEDSEDSKSSDTFVSKTGKLTKIKEEITSIINQLDIEAVLPQKTTKEAVTISPEKHDPRKSVEQNVNHEPSASTTPSIVKPCTSPIVSVALPKSAHSSPKSRKNQSVGYKTLKSSPKGWNPVISRDKLPRFTNTSPKPNKFFKARNSQVSKQLPDVSPVSKSNAITHSPENKPQTSDVPKNYSDREVEEPKSSPPRENKKVETPSPSSYRTPTLSSKEKCVGDHLMVSTNSSMTPSMDSSTDLSWRGLHNTALLQTLMMQERLSHPLPLQSSLYDSLSLATLSHVMTGCSDKEKFPVTPNPFLSMLGGSLTSFPVSLNSAPDNESKDDGRKGEQQLQNLATNISHNKSELVLKGTSHAHAQKTPDKEDVVNSSKKSVVLKNPDKSKEHNNNETPSVSMLNGPDTKSQSGVPVKVSKSSPVLKPMDNKKSSTSCKSITEICDNISKTLQKTTDTQKNEGTPKKNGGLQTPAETSKQNSSVISSASQLNATIRTTPKKAEVPQAYMDKAREHQSAMASLLQLNDSMRLDVPLQKMVKSKPMHDSPSNAIKSQTDQSKSESVMKKPDRRRTKSMQPDIKKASSTKAISSEKPVERNNNGHEKAENLFSSPDLQEPKDNGITNQNRLQISSNDCEAKSSSNEAQESGANVSADTVTEHKSSKTISNSLNELLNSSLTNESPIASVDTSMEFNLTGTIVKDTSKGLRGSSGLSSVRDALSANETILRPKHDSSSDPITECSVESTIPSVSRSPVSSFPVTQTISQNKYSDSGIKSASSSFVSKNKLPSKSIDSGVKSAPSSIVPQTKLPNKSDSGTKSNLSCMVSQAEFLNKSFGSSIKPVSSSFAAQTKLPNISADSGMRSDSPSAVSKNTSLVSSADSDVGSSPGLVIQTGSSNKSDSGIQSVSNFTSPTKPSDKCDLSIKPASSSFSSQSETSSKSSDVESVASSLDLQTVSTNKSAESSIESISPTLVSQTKSLHESVDSGVESAPSSLVLQTESPDESSDCKIKPVSPSKTTESGGKAECTIVSQKADSILGALTSISDHISRSKEFETLTSDSTQFSLSELTPENLVSSLSESEPMISHIALPSIPVSSVAHKAVSTESTHVNTNPKVPLEPSKLSLDHSKSVLEEKPPDRTKESQSKPKKVSVPSSQTVSASIFKAPSISTANGSTGQSNQSKAVVDTSAKTSPHGTQSNRYPDHLASMSFYHSLNNATGQKTPGTEQSWDNTFFNHSAYSNANNSGLNSYRQTKPADQYAASSSNDYMRTLHESMEYSSKKSSTEASSYATTQSMNKYNSASNPFYNSAYNSNYMNFLTNPSAQSSPNLSLMSGGGYGFPLASSKVFSGQQSYFGQGTSNWSAGNMSSNNFSMNSTNNYQNQYSFPGSNMNTNFSNFPFSYYPNYNSYSHFYQGDNMGIIPPGASSLMSSFPSRSSLSPRAHNGSQSIGDFSFQSGLFPMMPFVQSRPGSAVTPLPGSQRSYNTPQSKPQGSKPLKSSPSSKSPSKRRKTTTSKVQTPPKSEAYRPSVASGSQAYSYPDPNKNNQINKSHMDTKCEQAALPKTPYMNQPDYSGSLGYNFAHGQFGSHQQPGGHSMPHFGSSHQTTGKDPDKPGCNVTPFDNGLK